MRIRINLFGQTMTKTIPKSDRYKLKVGSVTKTLALGRKVTFKNVRDDALFIEPQSSTSDDNVEIKIGFNENSSKLIVIATWDDLPVIEVETAGTESR